MSNIVVVPEEEDKIRVCVDFRDLNRTSPKDNFSLSHIDMLVDNPAHSLFLYGRDMMHKEIEVYVDDMIAKSREGENHVRILKELFERLRKYKLRLNHARCSFRVKSMKVVGIYDE